MHRRVLAGLSACALFLPFNAALAQTTAGIGTTIVFPVTAQTTSFASEVTLFNPGPSSLTASLAFYEANNSGHPGLKPCTDITIAAARSAQLALATQCTLGAGTSHFGLLVVTDKAVPKANYFYGYMRVQNPQGIGFSVEGFPVQNFNNQVAEATGLMKQAAAPGYQTNCFVGSLDLPVSYTLKLFNGFTGAQIGSTLAGSLTAYQQIRYLDVFGSSGVNAPAGDQFNVRAEFTQTAGGAGNLIGFCTVQDNTSFGADFRVAKSYGSPSGTFFAQGGNAFGTTATLGTTDNQPLNIVANGGRVMRYEQNATSPNVIGGQASNAVAAGIVGAAIGGGGASGTSGIACASSFGCANVVTASFGTIGGGRGNVVGASGGDFESGTVGGGSGNAASGILATVAGGDGNTASGNTSAIGGGFGNTASGGTAAVAGGSTNTASGDSSFVAGGESNTASGDDSFVGGGVSNTASGATSFAAGRSAIANGSGCFVWGDSHTGNPVQCDAPNRFVARAEGGVYFLSGNDGTDAQGHYTGAVLPAGAGGWVVASDRNGKDQLIDVDAREVLNKVAAMPIASWHWKSEDGAIRHIGPMAQDFYAAFNLGGTDKGISTIDADGVALAAIQGLHRLLLEKDAQIQAQEARLTALELRLSQMEHAIADRTRRPSSAELADLGATLSLDRSQSPGAR